MRFKPLHSRDKAFDAASRGDFGSLFHAVQAVELIAGAINLALMSLNIRDGLRLTGRLMRASPSGR
jgi:hypothetical protein